MAYTPTTWVDDGAPPISAANLNKLEGGVDAAHTLAEAAQATADGKADAAHTHPVADLEATGTADGTTFLRGDGAWATPPGGGSGGAVDSVNGQTGAVTLDAADVGADATGTAAAAIAAHEAAADPHPGYLTAAEGAAAYDAAGSAAAVGDELDTHTARTDNPHGVTAAQVGAVAGDGITAMVALTQVEYDALTPDAATLYVITG